MADFIKITVGHKAADITGDTNEAIQAAVDRVAAAGRGTVRILPGNYIMKNSLHLKSGVTVQGSGDDTVLWKPPSVSSDLTLFLGYGHYDISVAEPEKFHIGMGIRISDNNSMGFYNTVATIIGKQGNELLIDRMLNHDYKAVDNGRVVSVYPVISGYNIENVTVSDLLIDGNAAENEHIDGCRGGGILLLQNRNTAVKNVTVKNYNGDGISFQQGRNTLIENCSCVKNTGSGLHPGSGSVGVIMRNTDCSGNGHAGIFYCLRVSYALCEGCIIKDNGFDGISIGHRDNDNIIRNNIISGNGHHGIWFRDDELNNSGNRTIITGNSFSNNCRQGGAAEILVSSLIRDVHILDNSFKTDETQKPAIYLNSGTQGLVLYNNAGLTSDTILAEKEEYKANISFSKPGKQLDVGPERAVENSCYHLGL